MKITKQAANMAKGLQSAVNVLLQAMAYKSLQQERMDEIDKKLLSEWGLNDDNGQPIAKMEDMYLCNDELSVKNLYEERDDAIAVGNFPIVEERGQCPALMADTLVREAERALIMLAECYFPGMTVEKLLNSKKGMDAYREYIELIIKLVVNAPKYQKPQVLGGAA